MIFEANNALRTASIHTFLSPSTGVIVLLKSWLAAKRWSLNEDTQRANTDSVIKVNGIPKSKALIPVHLPVPF